MICIAVAPEIGVSIAMDQYLWAREGLRDLKEDEPKKVESKDVNSKDVDSKGV